MQFRLRALQYRKSTNLWVSILVWFNSGPLSIRGVQTQSHFELPKHQFTAAEENTQFSELDAQMPKEDRPLDELSPGQVNWRTFEEQSVNMSDWQAVLDGNLFAYMFVEFRYEVEGRTKVTEMCLFDTKDFP